MKNQSEMQHNQKLNCEAKDQCRHTENLTLMELIEIALYTVRKINNYPSSFGKTLDNYFHLLFPDEIKNYLIRRSTNLQSLKKLGADNDVCNHLAEPTISSHADKVRDIRNLCQLFVEQQDSVLRLISDKLDELESVLSDADACKEGLAYGK